MALTVHYIIDWQLHSKCLQVLYSPEDHTGDNLRDAMVDSLNRWGLDPANLTSTCHCGTSTCHCEGYHQTAFTFAEDISTAGKISCGVVRDYPYFVDSQRKTGNATSQEESQRAKRPKRVKKPSKVNPKSSAKKALVISPQPESSDDEEWPCNVYAEPSKDSRSRDVWVQCQSCKKWAHEECTVGKPYFTCPTCESETD